MIYILHIHILHNIVIYNKITNRDFLSQGLDSCGESIPSILDLLFLSVDIVIQHLQLVYQGLLGVHESCWILLELLSFAALER